MSTRKSNPKQLVVGGRRYVYWVRELPYDETDAVPLNVIGRAEYGTRSVCTFTGFRNRERWHDYPDCDRGPVIRITPRFVCDLIGHAHNTGWAPSEVRANVTLQISNAFLSADRSTEGKDRNA